jgi:GNAT superfamily N-acetyltransferase
MISFKQFIAEETITANNNKKYEVRHTPPDNYVSYHKYSIHDEKGHQIGHADVKPAKKRIMSVHIDSEHRRKGLASALYKHIEKKHNIKLEPNPTLTDDGEKFWSSRK